MTSTAACTASNGLSIFFLTGLFAEVAGTVALVFFAVYIIIGLKRKGESLVNTTGIALVCLSLAGFFQLLWEISYPAVFFGKSFFWLNEIGIPIGLCFAAVFSAFGLLNLALMWLKVAQASKTMRKTGRNLSGCWMAAVAAFAVVFFVVMVLFWVILRNYTIGGLVAIVFLLAIGVAYLIGARELELVMNSGGAKRRSPQLSAIVLTARKVFGGCLVFTIVDLGYAATTPLRTQHPGWANWTFQTSVLGIMGANIYIFSVCVKYLRDVTLTKRGYKPAWSTVASTAKSSNKSSSNVERSGLYTATSCDVTTLGDDDREGQKNAKPAPSLPEAKAAAAYQRRRHSITYSSQRELDPQATVNEIIGKQLAPMVVVPFTDFRAYGKIPRSNAKLDELEDGIDNSSTSGDSPVQMGSAASISRPREEGWVVVFISHRWWGGTHPDDKERNLKHKIACRGIETLIRRDKLDEEHVAVWIDYACINQDEEQEKQHGIDSLIAYAAKSDYLLIPVHPDRTAVQAFVEATHPMHLANFGERAWCRLEVYVFSCLVEIMRRPVTCFAYGLQKAVGDDQEIPEQVMITGRAASSSPLLRCLAGSVSHERLVPLFEHSNGAAFAKTFLPSSGDLTVEDDRDVVRAIESIVQTAYSTFVIKNEIERLQQQGESSMVGSVIGKVRSLRNLNDASAGTNTAHGPTSLSRGGRRRFSNRLMPMGASSAQQVGSASMMMANKSIPGAGRKSSVLAGGNKRTVVSNRVVMLDSKQIKDSDIAFLSLSLSAVKEGQLQTLSLRDNMLTSDGVKELLRKFLTSKDSAAGRGIQAVDLHGNPIGKDGAMLFERCLTGGGIGSCELRRVGLASTGLDAAAVIEIAGWLGRATPLVELDLRGIEGELSETAVSALAGAAEAHGHLDIRIDADAMASNVPGELRLRFEDVRKRNLIASGVNEM